MASKRETRVIRALLERLYVSLGRGPAINCWPGRSRQRLDLSALDGLRATPAQEIFAELLSENGRCRVRVSLEKVSQPASEEPTDPEAKKAWEEQRRRWREQQEKIRLLSRLATIADDAQTYEQDTGAYILYVGYPLLSIPPVEGQIRTSPVLAPLAFIPVRVDVGQGSSPFVEISCAEEGSERVIPNEALRIWLKKQTGKPFPDDLFADEDGTDPQREIAELASHVSSVLGISQVPSFEGWPLAPVPRMENLPGSPALLACAVLGLYRLDYQNTIADLEALEKAETIPPTVHPFLTLNESLIGTDETNSGGQDMEDPGTGGVLPLEDEHLVTYADPCQRRAVAQARRARGLVIHGPPGTGKSQTITNIIGDSLARGERVLFVCEKRTALDVVKHRLDRLGLGDLCAVVHDASRDRTPLYKDIREMLENLTGSAVEPDPGRELKRATAEQNTIMKELRAYFSALAEGDESSPLSFCELTGQWFESFSRIGRDRLVELHPDLGQVPVELLLQRE